ncbi:hypothetical protein Tco_1107472 [Tanacetum coccineum]
MNDYEESAGIQEDHDSDLQSLPDDDLRSVFGFEVADSDDTNDNEVSHSAQTSHGIASAERLSIPDHLDHICEEVNYLHSRLGTMDSSIVQTVSDEIKSSIPAMITNALQEQLPRILSAVSEQFAETQAQLNKKVVKQLNKQFNISHVAQSNIFVTLQKELSKVIKSEVAKKVQVVRLEGVREKKQKDTNAIPAPTQEEQKTSENITPPELLPEIQGELAYKKSTILVSETKVNEESAMVLYNPKKDLVDLTTTEQDSEDDDDLDK